MSSNAFRPSHSHYRPFFHNHADDSVDHVSSQHLPASESAEGDDSLSITYAGDVGPAGYADDEYGESEEEDEDQDEQADEEPPEEPDDGYLGAPSAFPTAHPIYHGPYHHVLHSPSVIQPPGTYLDDQSDASDDAGDHIEAVNYLSIANILTSDLDMEDAFESTDALVPFSHSAVDYHYEEDTPQEALGSIFTDVDPAPSYWDMPGDVPPPQVAAVTSDNAEDVQQQLDQLGPGDDFEDGSTVWFPVPNPPTVVGPNISSLHPGNYPLVEFLQHWSLAGTLKPKVRERFPWVDRVTDLSNTHLTHVQYADLACDQCDIQGIDWEHLKVTRKDARERRLLTYGNYTNQGGSDKWHPGLPEINLPRSDSFFRFRRMDIRRNIHLSHFQLRNVLASPSRTQAFYTGNGVVHRFNPVSGEDKVVMKLSEAPHAQISTLAADYGVIVAGGFNGEYMVRPVGFDDESDSSLSFDGILTNHHSGITNHVQLHLSRQSSSPRAAFASNDQVFRVLDLETKTCISQEAFDEPINCTAISPDFRLRVMVGDTHEVLVAAAESTLGGGKPEILHRLDGHRDWGFACDWADDGWTVATGFQDRLINIWDARRWTDSSGNAAPVETIRTQMACVRSLHFSPIGSGKRVLVAAEEADFINIIDAQTFRSQQSIDIFGEIGGTAFTNDGQDLMVLCTDRVRGGIIQLERCGLGAEASWDPDQNPESLPSRGTIRQRGRTFDWPRNHFNKWKMIRESDTKRRRKAASLDAMEPF